MEIVGFMVAVLVSAVDPLASIGYIIAGAVSKKLPVAIAAGIAWFAAWKIVLMAIKGGKFSIFFSAAQLVAAMLVTSIAFFAVRFFREHAKKKAEA